MENQDHYPEELYSIAFSSQKNPDLEFEIRPLHQKDIEAVSRWAAESFANREPIFHCLGFTPEDLYEFMRTCAEKCAQTNTAVLCCEKSSGDYASLLFTEDLFDPTDAVKKAGELNPSFKEKDKIMGSAIVPCIMPVIHNYKKPDQPLQKLNIKIAITAPKYQGLGLITRLIKFALEEHPVLKKYKMYLACASNPGSLAGFERNGFKILTQSVYRDIEVEGRKVFETMEEELKMRGLKPAEKISVVQLLRD